MATVRINFPQSTPNPRKRVSSQILEPSVGLDEPPWKNPPVEGSGEGEIRDGNVGSPGQGCGPNEAEKEDVRVDLNVFKKNVDPNKPPSNIRCLLSTGIFEGIPIKYRFQRKGAELPGYIKGVGYACGCSSCNYAEVLNAIEFERHAGVTSKHQNNHIFFENGKTLHVVIKELKTTPLNELGSIVENLIGCQPNFAKYDAWKESFRKPDCVSPSACSSASKRHQPSLDVRNLPTSGSESVTEENTSSDSGLFHDGSPFDKIISNCTTGSSFLDEKRSTSNHGFPLTPSNLLQGLPIKERAHGSQDYNMLKPSDPPRDSHVKECRSTQHEPLQKNPPKSFKKNYVSSEQELMMQSSMVEQSQGVAQKRDHELHRKIFKHLPDGSILVYCVKGEKILEGYKRGNGIICNCCNEELSASKFESHAGYAARRQPYHNIYTADGLSLHEFAISLLNCQNSTNICSDAKCTICRDGGELILCDFCKNRFHPACLKLDSVPVGKWPCPNCKDRVAPSETLPSKSTPAQVQVMKIINSPAIEKGGCVICRGDHLSYRVFDSYTIMLCYQCEREYHVGCLRERGICNLKEVPSGKWFCSVECSSIFQTLQQVISGGPFCISPSNLQLIKGKQDGDVKWQVLSGTIQSSKNHPLLSKAAELYRKSFGCLVGRFGTDLVPEMVYGGDDGDHNFAGMYCVLLTVGSEVVCAGSLRIFNTQVAELPLVATEETSRRKGYLRCLFSCIENLLSHIRVKKLVLPAFEDTKLMWTRKFGFNLIGFEQLVKHIQELPIVMIGGTVLYEKQISQTSN